MASAAPTASTTPSLTATLASIAASGDTTVPLLMTRSAVTVISASQHGPAAIDGKIDAGDLARDVAREEQAGIGDVGVGRDALERIVGGMSLGGLLYADAEAPRHVGADLVAEPGPVDHARRDVIDVYVLGTG